MGAAPERSNLSFVSPLRESEVRTTTVTAFSNKPGPQRFARIPTHAIGVAGNGAAIRAPISRCRFVSLASAER